jgi:mechanosensitive ion channel-like protein
MHIKLWVVTRGLASILKLPQLCYLPALTIIAVGLSAQVSRTASDLPSNQHVIAFLTGSIDWYRRCAIERQIGTDAVDLAFLEDNRTVAAEIVQLSFDFARVDASVATKSPAANQVGGAIASGSSPDLEPFLQLQQNVELEERQASEELEAIKKQVATAHGTNRRKLQAALDATQSRVGVLQAGLITLRGLDDFLKTFSGRNDGDLASSIDDLARTVPEITNQTGAVSQTQNSLPSSIARPPDSGILALSSEVSARGRELRILDDLIHRTDTLRQSSDNLRNPLVASVNKFLPLVAQNALAVNDIAELQQQKTRLDEFAALVQTLSPAIVALDKQRVLLTTYTSHLKNWRAAKITENNKTWKSLVSRLLGAAGVISALLIIGAVVRRATRRHMGDTEPRHIALVIQRVVVWFAIVAVAAVAFVSDLTSSATFFGLMAAGVAVALQSVIIAALGYFVLVARHGIRIGDRVEISGVTGDVSDIRWLQFELKEIDKRTQQPTGRLVTFSNAFVFASPATGLSRFDRQEFKLARLEVAAKDRANA